MLCSSLISLQITNFLWITKLNLKRKLSGHYESGKNILGNIISAQKASYYFRRSATTEEKVLQLKTTKSYGKLSKFPLCIFGLRLDAESP